MGGVYLLSIAQFLAVCSRWHPPPDTCLAARDVPAASVRWANACPPRWGSVQNRRHLAVRSRGSVEAVCRCACGCFSQTWRTGTVDRRLKWRWRAMDLRGWGCILV